MAAFTVRLAETPILTRPRALLGMQHHPEASVAMKDKWPYADDVSGAQLRSSRRRWEGSGDFLITVKQGIRRSEEAAAGFLARTGA